MTRPHAEGMPSTSSDFSREAEIIQRLREALPADAQEGFLRDLEYLLTLAAEPRCAESQADGVPCATLETDCEHCGRALGWLRRLRAEVAKSAR